MGVTDQHCQTTVGVNTWVAHYSDAFSPDPDVFRPERWLESDKEKLIEMNHAHMPVSTNSLPRVPQ